MFENFRADIRQARKVHMLRPDWFSQNVKVHLQATTLPVTAYRFEAWTRTIRAPVVRHVAFFFAILFRRWMRNRSGVHIAPEAEIGPGFAIHTPWGIFVGAVKIGKNCIVQSGVLIHYEVREVGDNVYFGPGAKAIGDVRIGNNVTIVANSLVVTDIPDNCTAIGVPATYRFTRVVLPKAYYGREGKVASVGE
jgi:serine O-acetyltransferase